MKADLRIYFKDHPRIENFPLTPLMRLVRAELTFKQGLMHGAAHGFGVPENERKIALQNADSIRDADHPDASGSKQQGVCSDSPAAAP